MAAALIAALLVAAATPMPKADAATVLRAASGEIGLFYIFSSTCGPCKIASPRIRAFAETYGVPVRVISTDGVPSPDFPITLPDQGQVAQWGLSAKGTPALMLYQSPTGIDPHTGLRTATLKTPLGSVPLRPCLLPKGCLTFLGAGVMSADDIAQRVLDLLLQPQSPG